MNILKNTFTKAIASTIFLSFSVTNAQGVFISEYGEGSGGGNKWVEIYNGTDAAVDLSQYKLWVVQNGGTWPEQTLEFSSTAPLASGDVYVVANANLDDSGSDHVDQTWSQASWNGNDGIQGRSHQCRS